MPRTRGPDSADRRRAGAGDRPHRDGPGLASAGLRGDELHGGRVSVPLRGDAESRARRCRGLGRVACDGSRMPSRSKRSVRPSDVPSGPSPWSGPGFGPRIPRGTSPTPSRRPCGVAGRPATSFPPIVAVGVRAALPHARPTRTTRLGDADFVLLDWGASGEPYKSDLTRVLVTGKVTSKFEAIYRTVLAAQERAISAIRPGAKAHDDRCRSPLRHRRSGFRRFF